MPINVVPKQNPPSTSNDNDDDVTPPDDNKGDKKKRTNENDEMNGMVRDRWERLSSQKREYVHKDTVTTIISTIKNHQHHHHCQRILKPLSSQHGQKTENYQLRKQMTMSSK